MDRLTAAVVKFFEKKGSEIVVAMREELRKKHKEASGNLIRSIEKEVTVKGTRVWLRVLADETIAYVIGGRRKGKSVPVDQIEHWLSELKAAPKGDQKSLPWAMAASIKKKGVKGVRVTSTVAKKFDRVIDDELDEVIGEALTQDVEQVIFEQAKQDGLTVTIS